jgi:mono/diheme cytochrome c family protein
MKALASGAAAALVTIMALTSAANAKKAPAVAAEDIRGPQQDGAGLFQARCGYCHLKGGTGTMMLERRLGKDKALLADRSDLDADYVVMVARNGLNSMPTITRVEVTDAELNRIAAYIATRKKKAPGK